MSNVKPKITIFGAGITGLTAAHELATRGFRVRVVDKDYVDKSKSPVEVFDRGIGGMARSQHAVRVSPLTKQPSAPSSAKKGNQVATATAPISRLWSSSDLLLQEYIDFDENGIPSDPEKAKDLVARLAILLKRFNASQTPWGSFNVDIDPGAKALPNPSERVRTFLPDTSSPLVKYIVSQLLENGVTVDQHRFSQLFIPVYESSDKPRARFQCSGKRYPAEHGFRFFPSFYRHLFDTMRRTPILNPKDSERTKSNTFQNLVPCEGLGFARAGTAVSFSIPRRKLGLEDVRKYLLRVLAELDYTAEDITRFSLKLFKYMSTGTKRRTKEYEHLSWGDFVGSSDYSVVSREHIEFGPQMSAALRGSASDARTQGNITVQLLMDQLREDSEADYLLAGPTNGAWFNHWFDFLRSQDVTFHRGELLGFDEDAKPQFTPEQQDDWADVPGDEMYIVALSLPALRRIHEGMEAAASKKYLLETDGYKKRELRDFRSISDFCAIDHHTSLDQDLSSSSPRGPLQHLSGIQFFFDHDVRLWRGHTQYLDSAWGLTSVAQPQFWSRPRDTRDGYRSILSVDIGIFDRPYKARNSETEKTAWECSPDEIARLTWEQIYDHHDDSYKKQYGSGAVLPHPVAYAIDSTLVFKVPSTGDSALGVESNGSPFLVNRTGCYAKRPGELNTNGKSGDESKIISRYHINLDRYVFAGTYMQTFTRLTSMESANESARHAVNAILQKSKTPGDRCSIWDPEDHEPEAFRWLKELDDELCDRGLPHVVDILGLEEIPSHLDGFYEVAKRASARREKKGQL